ncbi:hypothetical protein [Streptococcus equi]|uniref:Putative competence-specific global transcription modulator n=1 Tax=Streptococcus equi subsp. equi (strain 4047) TaxID=553482 RepID=C0M8B7_STRE4|nr:hypothetical protein [Streptococcus equi]ASB97588.1 putative competence-specific global transcription modulator [Streptococcus equi subsp. equi]ASB97627.1 putative competence-specific global transcription modulator [Streptococcus equi subsp. equi]MBT1194488.1 competence protein ComX [Streptococcus equi subsp. equi]MBT1194525.1 competence protein ComX [Streptococcus equi subsp. equi]MBT1197318.1 competence protein ComX [Streptococcus equi subsp. equi]
MTDDLVRLFDKIKPIIMKLRQHYYIQLWELDDWLQEGRLILYRLLVTYPELIEDEEKLYRYFKTKFSSYLKDVLRQQESQKRRFHKMAYEEIGSVGHAIPAGGLGVDDYVAYQLIVKEVEERLTEGELSQFRALIRGERFEGRRALLRKIGPYFQDFTGEK